MKGRSAAAVDIGRSTIGTAWPIGRQPATGSRRF